jgi:hypothetical protein
MNRKTRKRLQIVCVLLAVLCIAGLLGVDNLDPQPTWANDTERTFLIGFWVFHVLAVLVPSALSLFDRL